MKMKSLSVSMTAWFNASRKTNGNTTTVSSQIPGSRLYHLFLISLAEPWEDGVHMTLLDDRTTAFAATVAKSITVTVDLTSVSLRL
jgi:hypothetical protein